MELFWHKIFEIPVILQVFKKVQRESILQKTRHSLVSHSLAPDAPRFQFFNILHSFMWAPSATLPQQQHPRSAHNPTLTPASSIYLDFTVSRRDNSSLKSGNKQASLTHRSITALFFFPPENFHHFHMICLTKKAPNKYLKNKLNSE